MSDIPVPLIIEIDITHVSPEHLGDQHSILPDFSNEVILRAPFPFVRRVDFVPCINSVFIVFEFYLACNQVC